jgi:hypothetical protein
MEKQFSKMLVLKSFKARELALERNATINVVVSRLVGIDGVIAIAEFIPLECADDTNIYVFWVFQTKVEEQDEDEHSRRTY